MRLIPMLLLALPMLADASSDQAVPIIDVSAQTLQIRSAQYGAGVTRSIRNAGPAVIVAQLSTDGQVVSARLQWTSGARFLDEAALRAVRRVQFTPGVERVRVPIRFRLGDSDVVSSS